MCFLAFASAVFCITSLFAACVFFFSRSSFFACTTIRFCTVFRVVFVFFHFLLFLCLQPFFCCAFGSCILSGPSRPPYYPTNLYFFMCDMCNDDDRTMLNWTPGDVSLHQDELKLALKQGTTLLGCIKEQASRLEEHQLSPDELENQITVERWGALVPQFVLHFDL